MIRQSWRVQLLIQFCWNQRLTSFPLHKSTTKVTRCFGTPVGFSLGCCWAQWPGGPRGDSVVDTIFYFYFCPGKSSLPLWHDTFSLCPRVRVLTCSSVFFAWEIRSADNFLWLPDRMTPWGAYKGAENVVLGPAGWIWFVTSVQHEDIAGFNVDGCFVVVYCLPHPPTHWKTLFWRMHLNE